MKVSHAILVVDPFEKWKMEKFKKWENAEKCTIYHEIRQRAKNSIGKHKADNKKNRENIEHFNMFFWTDLNFFRKMKIFLV